MIDITSQKVVIPTLAFLFMSPGVVATAPGDYAALAHAFAFLIAVAMVAKTTRLVLSRTDLIATTILFLALTPGTLFMTTANSGAPHAVLVHSIAFAIIFASLRKYFPTQF